MPRDDGPFEVLERINDNAYRIDLPGDYGVSATFNVVDLKAYQDDNYLADLRIQLQQGPLQAPKSKYWLGLLKRAKVKQPH